MGASLIGIFDSGVGGLSFYKEIRKEFPPSSIVYLADEGNFPYGEKSTRELREISSKNIKILEELGSKIILIACNSVTVSAISYLRQNTDLPIIEVEPAEAVVRRMVSVVNNNNLVLDSSVTDLFLTTGSLDNFKNKITKMLGLRSMNVRKV